VSVSSGEGLVDAMTLIMGYVVNAALLVLVVEKSKRCLDFTVTLFVLHLLLTTVAGGAGFPTTWDWWIVNVLGLIIMVCLGEYLCSRRELADIPSLLG